jgi:hypothetical protein
MIKRMLVEPQRQGWLKIVGTRHDLGTGTIVFEQAIGHVRRAT